MSNLCPQCGAPVNVGVAKCEYCGAAIAAPAQQAQPQAQPQQVVYVQQQVVNEKASWPVKSKIAAALLAFFLGGIGAHKFYLGQIGMGVVYLLFCWTFIPGIIAFIEFIILITMNDEKFENKYRCRVK